MIPKIICFIIGHKRTWKEFSGDYGMNYSPLAGHNIKVPIYIERKYENCPRCGKMLLYA